MKRFFEIFRAGNYPQGTFSEEDVQAIAESYDPSFLEAPITLDHGWGGPAYGWIEELKAEGGRLLATFKDVSDELAAMVANKRYKTHSVEIYNDMDEKGPYLKALSMLGAQSPQIKGMAPIEFSSFSEKFPDGESAIIDFDEPAEPEFETFAGLVAHVRKGFDLTNAQVAELAEVDEETLEACMNDGGQDQPAEETLQAFATAFEMELDEIKVLFSGAEVKDEDDTPKTFTQAEVNEKLSQFEEQIQNLTNELSSQKQTTSEFKTENERIKFAQRKSNFSAFLDDQVEAGKLAPKLKDKATAMFAHLDGLAPKDEQQQAPLALFKDIISNLPALDFEEGAPKGSQPKEFNSVHDIAAAAQEYVAQQKKSGIHVSYAEAVKHVKKQGPENE